MNHVNADIRAVIVVKLICIRVFQVPVIPIQGAHHQTTLTDGKPPLHKRKNRMSSSPPRARRLIVANRAMEIFRSLRVLFDPNQYATTTTQEKTKNREL